MKIEVGMYVKTGEGYFGKIIDIDNTVWNPITIDTKIDSRRHDHYPKSWLFLKKDNIKKSSHNIIDLIEPLDLMYVDISPDDNGGIVVPRVAETLNELDEWKSRFANGSCILKSVVTHEQLENGKYEIGE